MSGISADDNAMDTYQKLSRSKIQYVVFKIDKVNGSETIVVEKEGEKGDQEAKWAEFVEAMPESEGARQGSAETSGRAVQMVSARHAHRITQKECATKRRITWKRFSNKKEDCMPAEGRHSWRDLRDKLTTHI